MFKREREFSLKVKKFLTRLVANSIHATENVRANFLHSIHWNEAYGLKIRF